MKWRIGDLDDAEDLDRDLSDLWKCLTSKAQPPNCRPCHSMTPLWLTWYGDVHDDIVCRIADVGGPKSKENI